MELFVRKEGMNKEERIMAYYYIKGKLESLKLDVSMDYDANIAETLGLNIGEILTLKAGLADPSAKLVKNLKLLMQGQPRSEFGEVEAFLVKPFQRLTV